MDMRRSPSGRSSIDDSRQALLFDADREEREEEKPQTRGRASPSSSRQHSYFPSPRVLLSAKSSRRFLFTLIAALATVLLFVYIVYTFFSSRRDHDPTYPEPEDLSELCATLPQSGSADAVESCTPEKCLQLNTGWEDDPLNPKHYLKGAATDSLYGNLRDDVHYIVSWIDAGWTNDVMTVANQLYMAMITDRIPIVPLFTPSHIGVSTPPISFEDVFDVQRLSRALRRPILQWHDVKIPESEVTDVLGCWSVWDAVQRGYGGPRRSMMYSVVNLDMSYTRAPGYVKRTDDWENDPSSTYWSVATLAFPTFHDSGLHENEPLPSPQLNQTKEPSEQIFCYDFGYYFVAAGLGEWELDYFPVWRDVAQHMRWSQNLQNIADEHIRHAFKLEASEQIPPYISIHVRHADFTVYCQVPLEECFAPLSAFARRVEEVQEEVRTRLGIDATRVLVTSDEDDDAWWKEVEERGWAHIDFEALQTVERYGKWYPVLIDAVAQSNGIGFVGTDMSTMTTLARRRVESWHSGATRVVKWGHLGADDH